MARQKKTGRRHPLTNVALLGIGLVLAGGAYAAANEIAEASTPTVVSAADQVEEGKVLYLANCATCHGVDAVGTEYGPTLIGVGEASVDFQVMTGRMPMAFQGPQAEQRDPQFTQEQSDAMGAYIGSLDASGPGLPDEQYTDFDIYGEDVDIAAGAELFRINCAMCHNVAGAGGALTEGKFAPHLRSIDGRHIYEAMLTGPQNMPVFNDNNISPEDKRNIIAYLHWMDENPSSGGFDLGSLGPVSEGLFIWIFGIGAVIGLTVWLTSRPN